MDIVVEKKKKLYRHPITIGGVLVLVFATALYGFSKLSVGLHSVPASNLVTASVQSGDLAIKVQAPGILVPRDIRWIASNVEGRVERLLVKPGRQVSEGEVIIELSNPLLSQQVRELQWELEEMDAEFRALQVNQRTRLMDLQALKLNNEMQYEREKLRLDAEAALIDKDNATVSKLDYEARKLTVGQLKRTMEMDVQRVAQLKENLAAEDDARNARINRLKNRLLRAQENLASLQVRAPLTAVVQDVPLELGQRVNLGDNITRLARSDDLIAELSVPELSASSLQIGQKVILDTRFNKIEAQISRIAPSVTDGIVEVEAEIISGLPSEARPDLTISGEIYIDERKNTLFVRRPAFSQANRSMLVYKLDSSRSIAEQIKIDFGVSSSTDIEILAGLSPGDTIIVSEQREFERFDKIAIR